jgi:hypothetical protein
VKILTKAAFAGSLALGLTHAVARADAPPADGLYEPKPLDGVVVEAVETYVNPRTHELGLGVGLYPFNAYYYGMNLSGNYLVHLKQSVGWEIIGGSYFFNFDKGLASELADRYAVEPRTIEKLNFIVTSNLFYTFANGKFVFLKEHIRYFRASIFGGGGLVNSSARSSAGLSFGARFEVSLSETFSWRLEARDVVSFSGFDNFLNFTIGTGISF